MACLIPEAGKPSDYVTSVTMCRGLHIHMYDHCVNRFGVQGLE